MLRNIIVKIGEIIRPLFAREVILTDVERVCVFKTGALGDVLMATPLLHSLRKRYPRARIDFWTGNWAVDALYKNPNINNVRAFDPKFTYGGYHKTLPKILGLAKEIRKENYDVLFVLDKSYFASLFARILCRPRKVIGFDRHGEGFANHESVPYRTDLRKHESWYYMQLAKKVDAPEVALDMEMHIQDEHREWAKKYLKKNNLKGNLVGMAPLGGNPGQEITGRAWPIPRYIHVAKELEKEDIQVLLFGAPSNHGIIGEIAQESSAHLVKSPNVLYAAALIKECRAFVCNDAGLMHVAAALRVPVVSIFGMTDPLRKAPLGAQHTYLWKPMPVQDAEVFAVYNDAQLLNITNVHVPQVVEALKKVLG